MKIEDLPRPWLLAAVTGVPVAVLLERAEQEHAERQEEARRRALGDELHRRAAANRRRARQAVSVTGSMALVS